MRICKLLLPLLATSLCFASQPDRIVSAINPGQTVELARSVHPRAEVQYDQGPVEPSFPLPYMILMTAPSPSQQRALDVLLAQQQDPKSPNYHKWLTPAQFADRFGLSQKDLNKVAAWLASQGFQIISIGGGRNMIAFSGDAGQIQIAFGAEIHRYNINGEQHFANSSPLMLPAALNGIVHTITGVNDFRPHPASRPQGVRAMRNARADYYDGNYLFPNFLAPGDIGTIYDINPLYSASTPIDGTGQKLAIVGQTDILIADINHFRNGFGLNKISGCTTNSSGIVTACNSTNFKYVAVGTDPGAVYGCGDLGEADLDIEWSGAVARNAQIVYVNSPVVWNGSCSQGSGGGVNAALSAAINPPSGPPLAPVISMSYGICELYAEDLETLFQQANAEGVTIMNSSGDVGAATCDYSPSDFTPPFSPAVGGFAVGYPASSPEVTGVGGTEISAANDSNPPNPAYWSTTIGANGATALSYIPEIAWNDDEALGAFCLLNPQYSFCDPSGGVRITDAQTFQEDYWISIGGGGASNCWTESISGVCQAGFAQPAWQQGLSVASAPSGVRYVPDVSLLASPNFPGYVFCTPLNPPTKDTSTCNVSVFDAVDTYGSIVGGTSASSPVFAGIVTLLNQYLVSSGLQSTAGLGNINPTLYQLAATPSNNAFHNVTAGDNDVYCTPGQPSNQPVSVQCPGGGVLGYSASNFDATTHYNLVTGLGSVDVNNLFVAWAATLPGFTVAPSPVMISAKAGATTNATTVTATPRNGFSGTVTFSCSGLPLGATCNFTNTTSTSTQVTVSTQANMAAGSSSFTVLGTSGNLSSNTSVTLNLSASGESFQMATNPAGTSLTLQPGATSGNSVDLSLTDSGNTGFLVTNGGNQTTALPLTYTCTISPPASGASCNVSPTSPTSVINPTVFVQTAAPTGQLQLPFGRASRIFYAMLLPGLFGVVFAVGSGKGKRGLRLLSLIVALGASTLWLGACSGSNSSSNSNPGTPAGQYTVNISATTGGTGPITASTSFNLTVQ